MTAVAADGILALVLLAVVLTRKVQAGAFDPRPSPPRSS